MLVHSLALLIALAGEPALASRTTATEVAPERAAEGPARARTRSYLQREVTRSFRFLDHGVLAASVGVGAPHVYRVGVALGLFDHLTLGATMHWLPGERAPAWSPLVALAFYRGRHVEVGAHYSRILYPAPVVDLDPMTLSFQRRADMVLGTFALSQAWISGGLDIGWARGLEADPVPKSADAVNQEAVVRDRLAGGMHIRIGNRRWGVGGQVTYPFLSVELALDLRFGLFERRARASWWPI
ncbi:MAG: hypothetical protein KC420_06945 [Myxococcales bacterium]|nr:hypothetical protein [Myxococcales bacterium]MCB9566780.1 hypothetical protein [Myxococcales bacterium]MCB9704516.1 hypothetical protein [Myxococcales bacterium]